MNKILLVEDDRLLNKTLTYNLSLDGYEVVSVFYVRDAVEVIRSQRFDMTLLDVNLPDGNGYELCKLVKAECPDTLVIFLTANDQEREQVLGYTAGAIDYITKPFSIVALQHKLRAMFAMVEQHKSFEDIYDDGKLFLDFSRQTGTLAGKQLALSAMEYRMLAFFCQNAGLVLTRRRLLEKLWDAEENYVDEHTLTTAVSRIRGKIESEGDRYIKTVYGMGYQWMGESQMKHNDR